LGGSQIIEAAPRKNIEGTRFTFGDDMKRDKEPRPLQISKRAVQLDLFLSNEEKGLSTESTESC